MISARTSSKVKRTRLSPALIFYVSVSSIDEFLDEGKVAVATGVKCFVASRAYTSPGHCPVTPTSHPLIFLEKRRYLTKGTLIFAA